MTFGPKCCVPLAFHAFLRFSTFCEKVNAEGYSRRGYRRNVSTTFSGNLAWNAEFVKKCTVPRASLGVAVGAKVSVEEQPRLEIKEF